MFTFRGDFWLQVFNFTIFFTIVKKAKFKTHEFKTLYVLVLKTAKKQVQKNVSQCIPLLSWKVRKGLKTIGP